MPIYYVINNNSHYPNYRMETTYRRNAVRAAKRVSIYRGTADLVFMQDGYTMVDVYADGAFKHRTTAV